MIIGLEIFEKNGITQISQVSSTSALQNKFFSSFESTFGNEKTRSEILEKTIREATIMFESQNKIRPFEVIIFLKGSSLQREEIQALSKEIQLIRDQSEKSNLTIVSVSTDKSSNIYSASKDSIGSPSNGILIPKSDGEFWLFSKLGQQSPTLYQLIYSDSKIDLLEFAKLTYYLTYTYPLIPKSRKHGWAVDQPGCLKLAQTQMDHYKKIGKPLNAFQLNLII